MTEAGTGSAAGAGGGGAGAGLTAAARLALHLDQRRRQGEPGLVPESMTVVELLGMARQATAAPVSGAGERADARQDDEEVVHATLPALREAALGCTRCGLSESRKQVVFADGSPSARLMVVGEAPGAREDATGLPFVGQAGQLLDLILASVGLSRQESAYICNVLKCRPPRNRNPLPAEIECCKPWLEGQIRFVNPQVILAAGTFAAQWLTGESKPLHRLRGRVHAHQGVPLVVTYHPAALLRNPGWNRLCWDDLQLLCRIMDGTDA